NQGLLAWKVVCTAETAARAANTRIHSLHLAWNRGLVYRVFGELHLAEKELRRAQEGLASARLPFQYALVSLDLACVLIPSGNLAEVKELAQQAYEIFQAEGIEERALAAGLAFHRAAEAERLTQEMALELTDFLVRYRYRQDHP
ncbi:MAG: hypothetical protein R3325_03305, partial [Thermoanaerobaculia bacterium]|nr:hypothetical protein [Thermoanaerobaculia bacterium]